MWIHGRAGRGGQRGVFVRSAYSSAADCCGRACSNSSSCGSRGYSTKVEVVIFKMYRGSEQLDSIVVVCVVFCSLCSVDPFTGFPLVGGFAGTGTKQARDPKQLPR